MVDLELVALRLHRLDRGEVTAPALGELGHGGEAGAKDRTRDEAVEEDAEEGLGVEEEAEQQCEETPIIAP